MHAKRPDRRGYRRLAIASALDQFQRPQSAQGAVETAALRFVDGSRGNLFLVQRGGIGLRESLDDESFRLSQPAPLVIDESATRGALTPDPLGNGGPKVELVWRGA
jgi:hypothetical protein